MTTMDPKRLAEIVERVKPTYDDGNAVWTLRRLHKDILVWDCGAIVECSGHLAYAATVNALLDRMWTQIGFGRQASRDFEVWDMGDGSRLAVHPDKLEALFAAFEQRPDLFGGAQ